MKERLSELLISDGQSGRERRVNIIIKVKKAVIAVIKGVIEHGSLIILAIGAGIGWLSYSEYHYANLISLSSHLYDQDREFYKKIDGKPELLAVFIIPPKELSVFDGSNKMLLACAKTKKLSFTWESVPDLYEKLYEVDGFNNADKVDLRNALDMAENMLYLVYNVYDADNFQKNNDISYYVKLLLNRIGIMGMDTSDIIGAETWYAYISELGQNPLFLAAIYKGHKYGYFDEEFSAFIRERLMRSNRIRITLDKIYPELTKDDWVERLNEEYRSGK